MDKLTFTTMDAEILYAIPQPPSDILSIVRSFVFLNRAAPPSREELEECLRKAHCAGIVHSVGKKCAVSDKWYEEIHSADQTADNEIEAMLNLQIG